jgi:tRNA(Ile)-lysidine synthetase-like protein
VTHAEAILDSVELAIRDHDLITAGGRVTVLVSGGPDSTFLWHALRALGYRVSALHVDHGLRGAESDADAEFCREVLGAEVVDGRGGRTEDELRRIRYSFATDRLRATGHTADDQVETILFRVVTSGMPGGIKRRREDGVVRPLLGVWRQDVLRYLALEGVPFRVDSSNPGTKRGLIRERILPALRELDPSADASILRLGQHRLMPPAVAGLLDRRVGSERLDLGRGRVLVREYDAAWTEPGPVALDREVRWGAWRIAAREPGLKVRTWRPGDRLEGRSRKVQDVFVDAKVPRSERESWPLVVRGDAVVAVPGLVEAPGVTAERVEPQ